MNDELMRLRDDNARFANAHSILLQELERVKAERDRLRDENNELTDVLLRKGFRRCDIAACNCGSWHYAGEWEKRCYEIEEATNAYWRNGETLLGRIERIVSIADRRSE